MTAFSDLPHDIMVMILESVDEVWPISQLQTNRLFYTQLKRNLYSRIAEDNVICCEYHTRGFQAAVADQPDLLSSCQEWVLPMETLDRESDSFIYKSLHDLFPQVPACTALHLAVHHGFRPPTDAQAARLGLITDLTLSDYIPCHPFSGESRRVSLEDFHAWITHMPSLKFLDFSPGRSLSIPGLTQLPATLTRLELLGKQVWTGFSTADLRSILRSLPNLRHFMLAEMAAPVHEVASALEETLSKSVTSFGVGFQDRHPAVSERPVWESELGLLLQREYTTLTFYLVTHLVDLVDTLATSITAKSCTFVNLQTPSKPYPLVQQEGNESVSRSMYKLLDQTIFPSLARIEGGRIKEQMEKLGKWEDFSDEADEARVHLARLEW